MLGFIVGIFLLLFITGIILSAIVNSVSKEEVKVSDNTILHLSLDQPLRDRTASNPLDGFDFGNFQSHKQPGLTDMIVLLKKAETDSHVKGIYLDVANLQAGPAMIEELRNALINFRKSGKFVYAYAESYTQGAYYLATAADKIYLNPQGSIVLNGMMVELMFLKGSLEKLEVEPEIIRHGKYKSAVETFILDRMSDENRQQIAELVDPIWKHTVEKIAAARHLTETSVMQMADSLQARDAMDAQRLKLVDKLAYYDEFTADLNARTGKKSTDKPDFLTMSKYTKSPASDKKGYTRDRIAIVYATGEINSGEGDDNTIGSDRISSAIRTARLDENVKAVVLRVNSPGGSALASEVIWREVVMTRKVKPVVVSMGSVAASGGYYISCAADKIVAEPNTITGSIGVFGLLFNAQNLLKNKLGITVDTYKTNPYTDMGTVSRPLTTSEKLILQKDVDKVYNTFTRRVADGRKMKQADVDSIGQGRVWSGIDAKRLGLVDTLGGINEAIAIAARLGKTDNYKTKDLPEQKDPFKSIMAEMSGNAHVWYMRNKLGIDFRFIEAFENLKSMTGIQARSLFSVTL